MLKQRTSQACCKNCVYMSVRMDQEEDPPILEKHTLAISVKKREVVKQVKSITSDEQRQCILQKRVNRRHAPPIDALQQQAESMHIDLNISTHILSDSKRIKSRNMSRRWMWIQYKPHELVFVWYSSHAGVYDPHPTLHQAVHWLFPRLPDELAHVLLLNLGY